MAVSFYASRPNYAHHLAPIWFALPVEHRGRFWVTAVAEDAVRDEGIGYVRGYPKPTGGTFVVAAWSDAVRVPDGSLIVLQDHGVGQSYIDGKAAGHSAYVGGKDRDRVALFLEPGPYAAEKTRQALPDARIAEVGCVPLDPFHRGRERTQDRVVVSFHWPCRLTVESDWAWPEYRDAVPTLDVPLFGHGHPRSYRRLTSWYRQHGIEHSGWWDEALDRAQVYVADNSSTIYEAVSVGVPVVLLNSRRWRKNVEHGLRFWEYSDVGPQVDHPSELEAAITEALENPHRWAERREHVTSHLYAHTDGTAAARSAEAILQEDSVPNPYAPRTSKTIPRSDGEVAPQFPAGRLRRLGASLRQIEDARNKWDEASEIEREAEATRLSMLTDEQLQATLREVTPETRDAFDARVPDLQQKTIPEVLEWVGDSADRAQIALERERSAPERVGKKTRKTLVRDLEKIT